MSPESLHQSNIHPVRIDGIHTKERTFDMSDAKMAIVGLSSESLSLCIRAAALCREVVGFEADEVKVAQLVDLDSLKDGDAERLVRAEKLSITSDASSLKGSDVFFVCVPSEEVEEATQLLSAYLREGALVIIGSAVHPGTCEHALLPILEKGSGLQRPRNLGRGDFYFAHAPSASGANARVLGAADPESFSCARALYELLGVRVIPMDSIKEAESLPMVEDAFRDVSLALANELATVFDKMGIDVTNVIGAVSNLSRLSMPAPGIGDQQTSTKQFYRARSGHEHELDQQFLASARRIISRMPEYAVKVLSDALREKRIPLKGASIMLLGLAREKDNSDVDQSPALKVRDALIKKGAKLRILDPFVSGAEHDFKEAARGAQAALIATDHSVFCNLTPRHFEEFGISVVVDARNCLDKQAFRKSSVLYRGIGRG